MKKTTFFQNYADFTQHPIIRFSIVLLFYSLYLALFFPLFDKISDQYAAYSIIPIAIAAWFFYIPGAITGVIVMSFINFFLFSFSNITPEEAFSHNWPKIASHLVLALLIGYFRKIADQYKIQSVLLEEANKKLEEKVTEKNDVISGITSGKEKQLELALAREKDLIRSESYMKSIINSSNVIIIGTDINGVIFFFNKTAEELTEWKASEIIGKNIFDTLLHCYIEEDIKSTFFPFKSTESVFESVIICKNDMRKNILWQKNLPFSYLNSDQYFFYGIDITPALTKLSFQQKQENNFKQLFHNVNSPFVLLNTDYKIIAANKCFYNTIGVSPDFSFSGKDFFSIIDFPPVKLNKLTSGEYKHTLNFIKTGQLLKTDLNRNDTGVFIINISFFNSSPGEKFIAVLMREISDEIKAESEILRNFEHLDAIYDLSSKIIKSDDLDAIFNEAINCISKTLATNREAILLFDDENIMRFRAARNLSSKYMRLVEGHSPWKADAWFPTPVLVPNVQTGDNIESLKSIIAAEGIGAIAFIPIVYQTKLLGKLVLYYNSPKDISQTEIQVANNISNLISFSIAKKNSDDQLKKDQALYRTMLHNIKDESRVIDKNGIIIYDIHSNTSFSGFKEGELLGKNFMEFVHPSDFLKTKDVLSKISEVPDSSITVEFRFLIKRKIFKWVTATFTNKLNDPFTSGILFNASDIDAARKIAQETTKVLQHNSDFLDAMDAFIITSDIKFNVLFVNKAFCNYIGANKEEILGNNFFTKFLLEGEMENNLKQLTKTIQEKVPFQHQTVVKLKNGQMRLLNWSCFLSLDDDGNILTITAIGEDITDSANK